MVATSSDVVLVELPVLTTATLAALGYMIRQLRVQRQGIHRRLDRFEEHVTRSTVQDQIMERDVEKLKRELPPVRESVAVIESELSNHLRWHERHPWPP